MAVLQFLERCLGPYLVEVGERWARGELRVSHEHLATERTREFLSAHWRALAEGASLQAPLVVLATPPGERHVLGLHMAAWVVSLASARPIFLGADTPIAEIAFAAAQHGAAGVLLSVADGYAGDLVGHSKALSAALPEDVDLVIGGAGAGRADSIENKLNSFVDLAEWCDRLRK
jgi:hypothetical protein